MSRKSQFPVNFSELGGWRFLHFGSEWIQGGMIIRRPFKLALTYQQYMAAALLFVDEPKEILQLGLGAAGLAKFTWRYLPQAKTRVVEISDEVWMASRMWFRMPEEDDRLLVILDDCKHYLRHQAAESADLLFVDIYDATAWGPVYDDVPFYRLCRKALRKGGVASFNVFGGDDFTHSLGAISQAFDGQVLSMPATEEGNRIILARNGLARDWTADELRLKAAQLRIQCDIPTRSWLRLLQEANGFKVSVRF